MEKDYIQIINQVFGDNVFKYNDSIQPNIGINSDFDFKFKVIGVKKLISVGDWTNFLEVSVTIFNFRDMFSKHLFDKEMSFDRLSFGKHFYYLELQLRNKIEQILTPFDINMRVVIGNVDVKKNNFIAESKKNNRDRINYRKSEEIDPIKYYTQDHELKSQIAGFRRLSKLRKLPIQNIISNWFETHEDIHKLNKKEQKIVIDKLLSMIKK
jgi:hypothetical protein